MKMRHVGSRLTRTLLIVGLTAFCSSAAFAAPRVSQASLNLSTCGCPTWFADPTYHRQTSWEFDKSSETLELDNPLNENVTWTVTIEQSPNDTLLKGSGQIVITNSGEQEAFLSGLVLSLEESCGGCGDAIGPSGGNWKVWRTGALVRSTACQLLAQTRPGYGIVRSCYGDSLDDGSAEVVLCKQVDPQNPGDPVVCDNENDVIAFSSFDPIPATIDKDMDGRRDEDGACGVRGSMAGVDDDGDGRVDEDGACEDAVTYNFVYSFDIKDLYDSGDIQAGDAMRINLMTTFGGAGDRGNGGASCAIDIDCDGQEDCDLLGTPLTDEWEGDWSNQANGCAGRRGDNVRTVQQRGNFTMPPFAAYCDQVTFSDPGAYQGAVSPSTVGTCIEIENETWFDGDGNELPYGPPESILAIEEGQALDFELDVTVSCRCGDRWGEVDDQLDQADGDDDLVTIQCYHPGDGVPGDGNATSMSYWDCRITGAADLDFNRYYDAWCVDIDQTLDSNPHDAYLISTYAPEAVQYVEFPENLPNVNYLINNPALAVGQPAGTCGVITYSDVQRAIWAMVEEVNSNNGVSGWNECRVEYLVNAACGVNNSENRDGFVVGEACPSTAPGTGYEVPCNGTIAVMIVPLNTAGASVYQVNILQMPMNLVLDEGCPSCTDSCVTSLNNTASLVCDDESDLVEPSAAITVSIPVVCQGFAPSNVLPGDFCSYTMGGWGAKPSPNGNNPAKYLSTHFDVVYPDLNQAAGDQGYVVLGNDITGFRARWLSAVGVEKYLPAGGTSGAYTANLDTSPKTTAAGNFGGQLLAATLNVDFDAAVTDLIIPRNAGEISKPAGVVYLSELVYRDCVDDKLLNKTVADILAYANDLIDGKMPNSVVPANVTIAMVQQALAVLNQEFDNCDLNDASSQCFGAPSSPVR